MRDEIQLCHQAIIDLISTLERAWYFATKAGVEAASNFASTIDELSEVVPLASDYFSDVSEEILAVSSEELGSAHHEVVNLGHALMVGLGICFPPTFDEYEEGSDEQRIAVDQWGLNPDSEMSFQVQRVADKFDMVRNLFTHPRQCSRISYEWGDTMRRRCGVEATKAIRSIVESAPEECRPIVEIDPPRIGIDGVFYELKEEAAHYLAVLSERYGERVSDPEAVEISPFLMISRNERPRLKDLRDGLPAEVRRWIDSGRTGTMFRRPAR